ncbi:MAG: hypothetical protein IPK26_03975 [Planctomycetes bacterium]|nr:hypothetical protein [Planctomycetota bacterium]
MRQDATVVRFPVSPRLFFRVGMIFWWFWMLGVGAFVVIALWLALFGEPTPAAAMPAAPGNAGSTGPERTGTNPWMVVVAGLAMLAFGLAFRMVLRRSGNLLPDA